MAGYDIPFEAESTTSTPIQPNHGFPAGELSAQMARSKRQSWDHSERVVFLCCPSRNRLSPWRSDDRSVPGDNQNPRNRRRAGNHLRSQHLQWPQAGFEEQTPRPDHGKLVSETETNILKLATIFLGNYNAWASSSFKLLVLICQVPSKQNNGLAGHVWNIAFMQPYVQIVLNKLCGQGGRFGENRKVHITLPICCEQDWVPIHVENQRNQLYKRSPTQAYKPCGMIKLGTVYFFLHRICHAPAANLTRA